MITNNTLNTLNGHLATLTSLPDVAWPNAEYTPKAGTTYLEPTLLPANANLETLAGSQESGGVYQVSIRVELLKGSGPALTLADRIAKHFRVNSLSGVRIGAITVGPPLREDSFYFVPLSIEYWAHYTR